MQVPLVPTIVQEVEPMVSPTSGLTAKLTAVSEDENPEATTVTLAVVLGSSTEGVIVIVGILTMGVTAK